MKYIYTCERLLGKCIQSETHHRIPTFKMLDAATVNVDVDVDVDVDMDVDCLVDASLCTSAITMCVTLSVPCPVIPALCVLCMKENCFV